MSLDLAAVILVVLALLAGLGQLAEHFLKADSHDYHRELVIGWFVKVDNTPIPAFVDRFLRVFTRPMIPVLLACAAAVYAYFLMVSWAKAYADFIITSFLAPAVLQAIPWNVAVAVIGAWSSTQLLARVSRSRGVAYAGWWIAVIVVPSLVAVIATQISRYVGASFAWLELPPTLMYVGLTAANLPLQIVLVLACAMGVLRWASVATRRILIFVLKTTEEREKPFLFLAAVLDTLVLAATVILTVVQFLLRWVY